MISCQRSKSTFWKRIWPRLRMFLSMPIGSAGFSITQEEMNFQLWNIRRLRFDARSVKAVASDSMSEIIQETKRLIRLKHYSYSTERTYLQWIERFLKYARQTAKKEITETDASDFKNFLSHLALVQRVSASTQNQAFNAI